MNHTQMTNTFDINILFRGGSRISRRRGCQPSEGRHQHTNFPKNCMKLRTFWSIGSLDPPLLLHNYFLYSEQLSYIRMFSVYSRMPLISTDSPTGSGSHPCALLEICKYEGHPLVNWKISNIAQFSRI